MTQSKTTISFSPVKQSAFDARYEAQKIAFAPVVFQCVYYAWKKGVLDALSESGETGKTIQELASTGRWNEYALKVCLETSLSAGVVTLHKDKYVLDKIGYCFIADRMTQININFIKDVCYLGLDDLERSLDEKIPHGLKALGNWPTIYQGLSQLSEPASTSWFEFDHHYSDTSFPEILPDVFATAPKTIMDVGANTGKFATAALLFNANVTLHLVDLPQQLELAKAHLTSQGVSERAHFHPVDMLKELVQSSILPACLSLNRYWQGPVCFLQFSEGLWAIDV